MDKIKNKVVLSDTELNALEAIQQEAVAGSSCGPLLSSRHWQRPAPRASKIYSCSIVLLDTFVCFGIISTVIAFSHDFIIAVETH